MSNLVLRTAGEGQPGKRLQTRISTTQLSFPFGYRSWGYDFLSEANQYLGATLTPFGYISYIQ